MGRPGGKLATWGLAGVREGLMHGWKGDLGFFETAAGGRQFLGGRAGMRTLGGMGVGAGIGAAVYAATDSPLLGLAAGAGAMKAAGVGFRAAGRMAMNVMGPAFIAGGVIGGLQEGGLGGGIWGGTKAFAEWRLWSLGTRALQVAFQGTRVAGVASTVLGTAAKTLAGPLAVAAFVGYGVYQGAQYFAERGRAAKKAEFVGDMAAFQTEAAYSMRQRAMQEISRSHTNSRTILGNEAQLMHLR
jgi:hypothetical protein